MNDFIFKDNELYCESIPVKKIAEEAGTPFYLYSLATIKRHFKAFNESSKIMDSIVCFSVKANSNIAILNVLFKLGWGADIVSGGELFRSIKAGVDTSKVVYSGVGKTAGEIEFALNSDILMFNIESMSELHLINKIAENMGKKARISFRVNPDVDPKTHPYISTGMKKNKFGINIKHALESYEEAKKLNNIEAVGLDCHIGSQLTEVAPFDDAVKIIKDLLLKLNKKGFNIQFIDLGGGLGITYENEMPPHPSTYMNSIKDILGGYKGKVIFEPGRVIVGNSGAFITKVIYNKSTGHKNFVIVDGGMNDLIRPALYEAYHEIIPVIKKTGSRVKADVVGPICESADFLGKERTFHSVDEGDFLAVLSAGAYGFSMSSNYNSRPRAAEILVDGDKYYIIRKRETYEDLIEKENIPDLKL
ncbi:MAG: diaminopimelate decarboxylase [Candidatus Acididesulfobacter diazotrophicus]|jgi:diaminopimelate decarboxylase|uniref:Diaminopimelate decarboxylase n=1 Tax=Candidatus Acididesulfobacter diazotrophicus TaxID=2597226 RepID=A0A519BPF3_9DELT|nr:MAG: diaminopimelate decarboxylase [Candidatus Acididesulfobacter diazotrophicus]